MSAIKKKLSLSDKFGMLMSCLDTYFLEVSAQVLLKIATKGSFRGKKSKRRSTTKLCFFHNFGTFILCSDTYFLEGSARVFCT